jgi:hypothetical protein
VVEKRRFDGFDLFADRRGNSGNGCNRKALDLHFILALDLAQVSFLVRLAPFFTDKRDADEFARRRSNGAGATEHLRLTENRRGIETAADRNANGVRGTNAPPHGICHSLGEGLCILPERAKFQRPARLEVPIPANGLAGRRYDDEVSRHNGGDSGEARNMLPIDRARSDQHEIGKAFIVGLGLDMWVGQQRFDFGCKGE